MKIFYGNQYIKMTSWYRRIVLKIKRAIASFIAQVISGTKLSLKISAILCLLMWFGFGFSMLVPQKMAYADREINTSDEMFAAKIDSLKDAVVDQIMSCEGAGHSEAYGLVTYDPRRDEKDPKNIPSYGLMQFKQSTVIYYSKLLYKKDVTGKDAIILALNKDQARALAKDVMFKTKAMASGDWVNCAAKFDSDKQIILIKKLEK